MDDQGQKAELDELRVTVEGRWLTLRETFNLEAKLASSINKWQKFIKPTLAFAVVAGVGGFLTTGSPFVSVPFFAAAFSAKLGAALNQLTLNDVHDALLKQVRDVDGEEYALARAQWDRETLPGGVPQPR